MDTDLEENEEEEDTDFPIRILPEFLNVHNILRSYFIDSSSVCSVVDQIAEEQVQYQSRSIAEHRRSPSHPGNTPDAIMGRLFPSSLGPITTPEAILSDFKGFLREFMAIFPEMVYHEQITEDEATPEAPRLSDKDLLSRLVEEEVLPRSMVGNQEYNKAIMKLLYAYHMIRDRSGRKNFFFPLSSENYFGFLELFHFIYSNNEEKLLLLYALAMNDLGKSTTIIEALRKSGRLPETIYIDHDEKFFLFLATVNSAHPSILTGWNTVQFSSTARQLLMESQSTFINFPQLPQGEILPLCLKRFARLPKYVQSFRLVLQLIDMAGAKVDDSHQKSLLLKDNLYEHSIVGIHLLLAAGEAAYVNYFRAIFHQDLLKFFANTPEGSAIPVEERPVTWFYYARTAALARLNDHNPDDLVQVHRAWELLQEKDRTAFDCLQKEFVLTGCHGEGVKGVEGAEEMAILIYFAPAIMDMCMQACQKSFPHLREGKMKGIFYGLQTLALIYRETRASGNHNDNNNAVLQSRGEQEDSYVNVNAAKFVRLVRDQFAFFASRKLVVLSEDRPHFAGEIARFEEVHGPQQILSQLVLYSFVKYLTLLRSQNDQNDRTVVDDEHDEEEEQQQLGGRQWSLGEFHPTQLTRISIRC